MSAWRDRVKLAVATADARQAVEVAALVRASVEAMLTMAAESISAHETVVEAHERFLSTVAKVIEDTYNMGQRHQRELLRVQLDVAPDTTVAIFALDRCPEMGADPVVVESDTPHFHASFEVGSGEPARNTAALPRDMLN